MKKWLLHLVTVFAGCVMLASSAASADRGTIRIGMYNWTENIAVSNVWKLLLENRGYDVELVQAGKALAYSGVAAGDLDVNFEVWLPTTDKPYYERFKQRITLHDAWYRGTNLGLVVPAYVDVESIGQLNERTTGFVRNGQPTIVGIGPGASIMRLTKRAIDTYGLDFHLLSASGPAMTAALDRAIANHKPVVVTLWNPHWAFAEYDLKYLQDPKGIYGEGERIYWMSSQSFAEEYPQVTQWFNNWDMTHAQLGSLMNTLHKLGDPEKAAAQWIKAHHKLVDNWFASVGTQ